jgi:hypothetical protein
MEIWHQQKRKGPIALWSRIINGRRYVLDGFLGVWTPSSSLKSDFWRRMKLSNVIVAREGSSQWMWVSLRSKKCPVPFVTCLFA